MVPESDGEAFHLRCKVMMVERIIMTIKTPQMKLTIIARNLSHFLAVHQAQSPSKSSKKSTNRRPIRLKWMQCMPIKMKRIASSKPSKNRKTSMILSVVRPKLQTRTYRLSSRNSTSKRSRPILENTSMMQKTAL